MISELIEDARKVSSVVHDALVAAINWIRKNPEAKYLDPIELLQKKVLDRTRPAESASAIAALEYHRFLSERFAFKGNDGKFIEGEHGILIWDTLADIPEEILLSDGSALDRASLPICVIFEINRDLLGYEESAREKLGC